MPICRTVLGSGISDLESVLAHKYDGLEWGPAFIRQLLHRLLLAPDLLQQRVASHAGRALETRAVVQGHVRRWPGTAAAGQVNLKPQENKHAKTLHINKKNVSPGNIYRNLLHISSSIF